MRILHIVPSYKPAYHYGGPIISVSRLAEEQAKAGAAVSVYTTTANGTEELDIPNSAAQDINGVQVHYFKRWTGDHGHFSPALLMALRKNTQKFDRIHIHSWWNWVAFGAALICRKKQPVLSPRGMLSPYTLQRRSRLLFQRSFGAYLLKHTLLHATSEQEAQELRQLHPKNRIAVLPNIIELPPLLSEVKRTNSADIRLLFMSRIDPKKGLELLFEALAKTARQDWQLFIAGVAHNDYEARLRRLATRLKLSARIHWLGWQEGQAKWELLANADIMVLPSYNDNFANIVLESLAVGTPVLVSDQVGMSRYVRDQNFGWCTTPAVAALQKSLEIAMLQEDKRNNIRQTAVAKTRMDFDPGHISRQYLKEYEKPA